VTLRSFPATAALLAAAAAPGLLAGCASTPTAAMAGPAVPAASAADVAVGSASALAGGLLPGVPGVVPVPPAARVTGSAVQARGGLLAVSVSGTSTLAVRPLLDWFTARLRSEGFTAAPGGSPPAPGAGTGIGTTFSRPGGREILLVAVADRGGERSWSVGGTVAPTHGG